LKLAARLLSPQNGRVLLRGENIRGLKRRDFARRVSILTQNNRAPQITVADAVLLGRHPYQTFGSAFSARDRQLADAAMQATCCGEFRNQLVSRLSGGERQRVFLAMVLAQDTEIIFLDEPTTYLDINICYEIMELIVNLHEKFGKTFVLVLHDLNLALRYSHQLVLLDKGAVVHTGTPSELVSSDGIGKVFGVSAKRVTEADAVFYCFDKI
jgi:iron complex transport system ATP-binding protein